MRIQRCAGAWDMNDNCSCWHSGGLAPSLFARAVKPVNPKSRRFTQMGSDTQKQAVELGCKQAGSRAGDGLNPHYFGEPVGPCMKHVERTAPANYIQVFSTSVVKEIVYVAASFRFGNCATRLFVIRDEPCRSPESY